MANAIIVRPLPFAAVTGAGTASGHDPAYVGNDFLGVVWKTASGTGARALTIDMGADVQIDTIALFGLNAVDTGWEVSAATEAQGSSFSSTVWTEFFGGLFAGSVMPVSGRGKALWVSNSGLKPAARYYLIVFPNPGVVTVGRVVIGQRIALQRNFAFGAAFGVRELGRVDFSRRGVMLRARGAKQRSVGITFPHVHRDEVEAVVHPLLERIGGTEPVLLVTDPDANAQRQNRMFFGPLIGDIGTIWARPGGFEWRANLTALDN